MASRQRQSTASATPARRCTVSSAQTPSYAHTPYQPPSLPLNTAAQQALSTLLNKKPTNKVTNYLKHAVELLNESAADINERLAETITSARQRQEARTKSGKEDADADENAKRQVAGLKKRIDEMTGRLEASVRKAIDGHAGIDAIERAIREVQNNTVAGAASQVNATQRTTTTAMVTQPGATADEDADMGGSASTAYAPPSLHPAFEAELDSRILRYSYLTLFARYAHHNDYVNFKRTVHDAQYNVGVGQGVAPDLPHARTWFSREEGGGSPPPGVTGPNGVGDDSDNDLAIARERISTRCPLTLREYEDPVQSRKCRHSFERTAIHELILQAPAPPAPSTRRGAPAPDITWIPSVRCPVPGCESQLCMEDLESNPTLVRTIKRIQRAAAAASAEGREDRDGGEGGNQWAESIDSDSGEDIDAVERRVGGTARGRTPAASTRIKAEMMGRRRRDEIED